MNHRPYIHPIVSPDGKGILTEYSPGHHKHQTGLYWGFTRINGTGADEETLKEIAQITNGIFFRATDNQSLMKVYEEMLMLFL